MVPAGLPTRLRARPAPARVDPARVVVFDVLSVEGRAVMREPYSERRRILEQLDLAAPRWHTPEVFDDGAALWEAVCEHELEGVVAKRRSGRYLPGEPRLRSSPAVPGATAHRVTRDGEARLDAREL